MKSRRSRVLTTAVLNSRMPGQTPKQFHQPDFSSSASFWETLLASIAGPDSAAQTLPPLDAGCVASGLLQPLFVTAPPEKIYGRLFIVRQTGQVHILNIATGNLNAAPFLDMSARLTSTSGEQGLLGMAFDPNYATLRPIDRRDGGG